MSELPIPSIITDYISYINDKAKPNYFESYAAIMNLSLATNNFIKYREHILNTIQEVKKLASQVDSKENSQSHNTEIERSKNIYNELKLVAEDQKACQELLQRLIMAKDNLKLVTERRIRMQTREEERNEIICSISEQLSKGDKENEDCLKRYYQEYMKKSHVLLQLQFDILIIDKECLPLNNTITIEISDLKEKYNTAAKHKEEAISKFANQANDLIDLITHVKQYFDCPIDYSMANLYSSTSKSNKALQQITSDLVLLNNEFTTERTNTILCNLERQIFKKERSVQMVDKINKVYILTRHIRSPRKIYHSEEATS